LLPYHSIKLVHETSAENREIWVVHATTSNVSVLVLALLRTEASDDRWMVAPWCDE
jgi:hypothetical protein